jgi:hypothetical protein
LPSRPRLQLADLLSSDSDSDSDNSETHDDDPSLTADEDSVNENASVATTTTGRQRDTTKKQTTTRYWRKSMRFKTIQERDEKLGAAFQDLGQIGVDQLKALKTCSGRRPFLAAVIEKGHQRKTVSALLNLNITRQEWWKIGVHARYPGKFKDVVKAPISRMRVDERLLRRLLEFLEMPGNLQRYAFGTQLRVLLDGSQTAELDKVSRCKKLDKLVADFITAICSEIDLMVGGETDLPAAECRCKKLEKSTLRRCMKEQHQEGRCEFTPKSTICSTTVRELIQTLTAGDIKSLSGLDDVRVLKGRDNFEALRGIAKRVCRPGDESDSIINSIDEAELFHQTDFVPHLRKRGSHRCNCVTCGFNDSGESFLSTITRTYIYFLPSRVQRIPRRHCLPLQGNSPPQLLEMH